jgi:hypothetical protein
MVLNDLNKQANIEMEKKGMVLPGYGVTEFSEKSDEELATRRDELIERAKRFVGSRTSRIDGVGNGIEEEGISEPS